MIVSLGGSYQKLHNEEAKILTLSLIRILHLSVSLADFDKVTRVVKSRLRVFHGHYGFRRSFRSLECFGGEGLRNVDYKRLQ